MNFIENMSSVLEDVKVVLDIGSRWGEDSQKLQRLFPNAEIYAFECTPFSIKLWKKDEKNKGIHLIEKAVSNYTGDISFNTNDLNLCQTPHLFGNQGANSIYKMNPDCEEDIHEKFIQHQITVPCITIQDWAKENGIKEIDVVWIDIQGAELMAFQGMGDLLSTVKVIHAEVEFAPMYIGQPLFNDINRFLRLYGFDFINFENVSKWFADANFINAKFNY